MKRSTFYIHYILCVSLLSVLFAEVSAQQVNVRGGFFKDSTGIGQPTKYFLTARYPQKVNIIFPDSTYDYKPFEFEKKQYFATHTKDSLSYDSVIYSLSTYEVDSIQYLSLPVYAIAQKDCVAFDANRDSIILSQLVKHVPDSLPADKLPLKMNTAYRNVSYLYNYPVISFVSIAIVVIALVLFLIFGKRIRKHFRVKRLMKAHQKFLQEFNDKIKEIQTGFTIKNTESALILWKHYMEHLISVPYLKLTTREILLLKKDIDLDNSLQAIDKAIYGHETSVIGALEKLRDYSIDVYLKKLEAVKHGK